MRLGKYLSDLTKPELEELKEQLNLSEDEELIFSALSKIKSRSEMSFMYKMSERTIDRKVKHITEKVKRMKGYENHG